MTSYDGCVYSTQRPNYAAPIASRPFSAWLQCTPPQSGARNADRRSLNARLSKAARRLLIGFMDDTGDFHNGNRQDEAGGQRGSRSAVSILRGGIAALDLTPPAFGMP